MSAPSTVTVIVPVHRGLEDVRRCLESVWRHLPEPSIDVRLTIVDDASPEPGLPELLDAWAVDPDLPLPPRLLRNTTNAGFVVSVNRALRDTTDGDVVVLNADTVVTAGWLDRLADAATAPGVATVTPLTGFGSLCTLPDRVVDAFGLDGDEPRIDECAAFLERHGIGRRPHVISGVGFCLYVTRAALDAVGLLDEAAFGRGYGEEVDFCLRATQLGFHHVVEDRTFVHHAGGGSFGDERSERMAAASAVLHDRYPWFRAANRAERRDDPLRLSFTALEMGLDERDVDRPHVLHLLHGVPESTGGTEKHLEALMAALEDEFDFSVLFPVPSAYVLRTRWRVDGRLVERELLVPGAAREVGRVHDEVAEAALRTVLDLYDVDAVHIQHLRGHSLAPLHVLADVDVPVTYSVRDGHPACPRYSLLYRDIEPCGIPEDLSWCARCLDGHPTLTLDTLVEHRSTVAARLDTVDHWVFASQSAADHMLRAYDLPLDRVVHIPHGAIVDLSRRAGTVDEALIAHEPLRIGFVGRGWYKKGMAVVNALAERLADTTIELHHLGGAKDPASPRIHQHGPYDNAFLGDLLHRAGIQIVLLPGPYAETFGHVMTEALVAGRPVIGAHYGSLGERIRDTGAGWVIDPFDLDAAEELLRNLDGARDEVARASRAAAAVPLQPVAATAERYAQLYRSPDPATRNETTVPALASPPAP